MESRVALLFLLLCGTAGLVHCETGGLEDSNENGTLTSQNSTNSSAGNASGNVSSAHTSIPVANVPVANVPTARATANVTWNGCKCKLNGPAVEGCTSTCCPSQLHPSKTWCFVEDKDCEDSEFGYCRPDGYVPKICRDWPKGWKDSKGHDCGLYGSLGLCTLDGQKGSGWKDEEMGEFYFSKDSEAARHSCCNCGGGFAPTCHDVPDWTDPETDGCKEYLEHAWCDGQGQTGLGWYSDQWGGIAEHVDKQSRSALDACCACGGGISTQSMSSSKATWRGCKCREGWTHKQIKELSCQGTCCNPDKSPFGDWCVVEDQACQRSSWGYCRPSGIAPRTCEDLSKTWKDKFGHGCNEYGILGLCNADGSNGAGWKSADGTFADASVDGVAANTACCNCGGGKSKLNCTDRPDWKDSVGDACHVYQDYGLCNANGGEGPGWQDDYGDFDTQALSQEGVHARDACCACGRQSNVEPPLDADSSTTMPHVPTPDENVVENVVEKPVVEDDIETGTSMFRIFIGAIIMGTCGLAVWKWTGKSGDDNAHAQNGSRKYGKSSNDGL